MSEIFIRYGEIGLKSPPVRNYMEKRLATNIQVFLEKIGIKDFKITINRSWGRIIIKFNPLVDDIECYEPIIRLEEIAQLITLNVFGVVSTSVVQRIQANIEIIKEKALLLASKNIKPNSSFAVRVRRIGTHTFTSKELEAEVGGAIYLAYRDSHNLSVNLTKPDYLLQIEIKDEWAFLFDDKFLGFGGLPQGTQGKIVSILRGSLEDAIAAFLLCKRGVIMLPIIFEIDHKKNNHSNVQALSKQLEFFDKVQPKRKFKLFKIDFEQVVNKIGYDRLQCSTCDKVCIGITEKIIKDRIKTGITLGNATDTLSLRDPEITLSNEFIPIYYPLLVLDKEKIKHPFNEGYVSEFCLVDCPGYQNQKKGGMEQLSADEIQTIVASIDFSLVLISNNNQ